MIFLQLFIFAFIIVAITYFDKKIWGTLFTPAIVLAWPFYFLLLTSYIYLKINFYYFELNYKVIPIWIISLFFFWLGSLFIKLVFVNVKINSTQIQTFNTGINITKDQIRLLLVFAYSLILLVGYKVYLLLAKFDNNLADEDFQKMLGSGFIGHSILFLTIITIFLIIYFEKKHYKIHQRFIIFSTLLLSILYGVKSWLIIPLVSSFLGRLLLQKTKLKLKHGLFALVPFFVFWLIYQISLGMNSTNNEFIFTHMRDYLLAGPIGFSEHLNQELAIGTVHEYAFTPVINIFRFIIGEKPLDPISNYFVTIPTGLSSNVKTFFGTIYIYGGHTFFITAFILGIIFYSYLLILSYSLNSKNAPFIATLYAFMLGLLFMGWFDCYVIHLSFYEVPFMATFLHWLLKIKIHNETPSISKL